MYNYINYLNVLLIIILVVLVVYIGFELYYSNQTPKKYDASTFDKEDSSESVQSKAILDHVIKFKNDELYNGVASFIIKTTNPSKNFNIDWGNGLQIPYTGSSFAQKIPPVFYKSGFYTITIYCEEDTFNSIECVSIPPNIFKRK